MLRNVLVSHVTCNVYIADYVKYLDQEFYKSITDAYAPSTIKNFKSIWIRFITFHNQNKLQLFPPWEINIRRYFTHLTKTCSAYGSILNYSSAIKLFYNLNGYEVTMSDIHMQLLLKAAKRNKSASSKPKAPIEVPHLLFIVSNANYMDACQFSFVAAVLIAFFGCLRRSNVVPPSEAGFDPSKHLTRSSITIHSDSIILALPWTKTLQNRDQIFTITIAKPQDCIIDPVAMYVSFITKYPAQPLDPAFCFYKDGARVVLTQPALARRLKAALSRMGVPAAAYGTHSLRRGGTSLMYSGGIPAHLLRAHGTWKGASYQRYIELNHRQKKAPTLAMYTAINQLCK